MRLFDRTLSFWILVFCLPLLFLPKINLISLSDRESAGIRVDDIVLLIFFVVLLFGHLASGRGLKAIEKWVFVLVAFSFVSLLSNRFFIALDLHRVQGSLFYCLRLLEYFLFFYIGALSTRFFKISSLIKALFLWNLVLMLLQRTGLIGQFSISGYLPTASDRVTGIASFPSEAGMLLSLLFCFLINDEDKSLKVAAWLPKGLRLLLQRTYTYLLFLICMTLVIFTGSRIAIIGLSIAFLCRLVADLRKSPFISWVFATIFLAIACIIMSFAIMKTDSVFERSAKLLSFKNVELVEKVWHESDPSKEPPGQKSMQDRNYDMSWWIRIYKWCYALKIYLLHPESYLQGMGPGFTGAALDGGFLRILTEYGIIGVLLFFNILLPIYRKTQQLKWMVVVFLINMIFFDVYLAYKPMSLLFFATGYAEYRSLFPSYQEKIQPALSTVPVRLQPESKVVVF